MCCIREDYAFKEANCVICEMTFVKNGTLVYIEDLAGWLQIEEQKTEAGESSAYLGTYTNLYEAAKEFTISLETKRPTPVVACTEFESAEGLRKELERRARYFKEDEVKNYVESGGGYGVVDS